MIRLLPFHSKALPAITNIYAHAVKTGTATFEVEPPNLEQNAAKFAALLQERYPVLVAQDETGDVLGYAYAGPYRPRAAYWGTVEDTLYLAPHAQGRGLGKRLLNALIDITTRDPRFREMIAVIGQPHNAPTLTPSERLHAACGFRRVGVLPRVGNKHGVVLDTVLMQRSLDDSSKN
jgi:L-amino acid N-acyltransferase YncA